MNLLDFGKGFSCLLFCFVAVVFLLFCVVFCSKHIICHYHHYAFPFPVFMHLVYITYCKLCNLDTDQPSVNNVIYIFQNLTTQGTRVDTILELAVHRVITCASVHPADKRRVNEKVYLKTQISSKILDEVVSNRTFKRSDPNPWYFNQLHNVGFSSVKRSQILC